MLQPKEKVIDIVNSLLEILRSNSDLGDQELAMFREIKSLNQGDYQTDLAYALFYFSKNEHDNADKYFNKSIRNSDINCIGNYISFLLRCGLIRKAISTKNRFKQLFMQNLDHISVEVLYSVSFLEGDIGMLEFCLSELQKRKSDLIDHRKVMKQRIDSYKQFMEYANISPEQVSKIHEIMIDVFEKSELERLVLPAYETDLDYSINALVMYVDTNNIDALVKANFLLAEKIADDDQFIGKRFTPVFEMIEEGA